MSPTPMDIDRFRGWALIALYASMAVLSILLVVAIFLILSAGETHSLLAVASTATLAATAIFSLFACSRIYHALQAKGALPRLALLPFIFMALSIIELGELFGHV